MDPYRRYRWQAERELSSSTELLLTSNQKTVTITIAAALGISVHMGNAHSHAHFFGHTYHPAVDTEHTVTKALYLNRQRSGQCPYCGNRLFEVKMTSWSIFCGKEYIPIQSQTASDGVCRNESCAAPRRNALPDEGHSQSLAPLVEGNQQEKKVPTAPTEDELQPNFAVAILDSEPELSGPLADVNSVEVQRIHGDLRTKIGSLMTVEQCRQLYDDPLYQECIRLLQRTQAEYKKGCNKADAIRAREEWARMWARALSEDKPWAWALNYCRKTALLLLYRVCDLCTEDDEILSEFEARRIDRIIGPTLVMDRANALYNMRPDEDGPPGLGWYAGEDEDTYLQFSGAELNPRGPTINKRLKRVYKIEDLNYSGDKAISKWMKIKLPSRVESPPEQVEALLVAYP